MPLQTSCWAAEEEDRRSDSSVHGQPFAPGQAGFAGLVKGVHTWEGAHRFLGCGCLLIRLGWASPQYWLGCG